MANLTKKYMIEYVDNLNKKSNLGLKLEVDGSNYALLYGSKLIFAGLIREVYFFLQGLCFGINLDISVDSYDSKVYTDYELIKDKVGQVLKIKAKKVCAESGYYDQFPIHFDVQINAIKNDILYFTSIVNVKMTNGEFNHSEPLSLSMLQIKIDKSDSLNQIVEKILKSINVEVIKLAHKDRKKVNHEYILWLTRDDAWYIGWKNKEFISKVVTKSVKFEVVPF